jgi:hypothetical protein
MLMRRGEPGATNSSCALSRIQVRRVRAASAFTLSICNDIIDLHIEGTERRSAESRGSINNGKFYAAVPRARNEMCTGPPGMRNCRVLR